MAFVNIGKRLKALLHEAFGPHVLGIDVPTIPELQRIGNMGELEAAIGAFNNSLKFKTYEGDRLSLVLLDITVCPHIPISTWGCWPCCDPRIWIPGTGKFLMVVYNSMSLSEYAQNHFDQQDFFPYILKMICMLFHSLYLKSGAVMSIDRVDAFGVKVNGDVVVRDLETFVLLEELVGRVSSEDIQHHNTWLLAFPGLPADWDWSLYTSGILTKSLTGRTFRTSDRIRVREEDALGFALSQVVRCVGYFFETRGQDLATAERLEGVTHTLESMDIG